MDASNLYETAQNKAAFYPIVKSGYLRLEGEDRLDFLQRQTSNDVRSLNSENAVLTVLTSPTARILDVLYLISDGESTGIITLPGYFTETNRFLQSRIFFMDNVTIRDESASTVQIDLLGPLAKNIIHELGFQGELDDNAVTSAEIGGAAAHLISMDHSIGLGFRLLASAENGVGLIRQLDLAGAVELDESIYHLLRIEAGLPAPALELTDSYTPLEVGLETAISDSKGCYTGQEVIARQISYNKVVKNLCGLTLDAPVEVGDRVWVGHKAAGTITSATRSPRFGEIALAVIKRSSQEPGTAVVAGKTLAEGISGIVRAIPFRE